MMGTAHTGIMRARRSVAQSTITLVVLYVWAGSLCYTTAQTAMRVGSFSALNLLKDKVPLRNLEGVPDPMKECSVQQTIQMEWDVLMVSRTSTETAYALSLDTVSCKSSECPLLAVDGWTVTVAGGTGSVMLGPAPNQFARYPIGQSAVRIILLVAAGGKARLCVGSRCSVPSQVQAAVLSPDGWVSAAGTAGTAGRPSATLQLGFRGLTVPDAVVSALWVLGSPASGLSVTTLDPATVWSALLSSGVSQQPLSTPSIAPIVQQPGGLVVGQTATFSASATVGSGAAACQLRLTVFGVPPPDCKTASCGNLVAQTAVYDSSCSVSVAATYPRAGRYLVRAEASDAAGGWSSRDLEVIVRKIGDTGGAAPCCRQTALIVTSQLGRPIHTRQFRPKSLESAAAAAGWSPSYMQGPEDLEAERLFDYGMLAPFESRPVRNLSCADAYLAGQGSPAVFGITAAGLGFSSNHGHNKRVVIVPQGFNWTSSPPAGMSLPSCTTHWSDWPSRSPYQSQVITSTNARAACSYTCTVDGMQQMVDETGTYNRWREAVIESTYGQLSLAPDPVVVPTLYMPPTADGKNAFSYSEAPVGGYLQQLGYDMGQDFHTVLVLSPSPRFVNPGYTAWANGYGSPMMFVMRCNPQHYYLLHEIGHRLGMPHATIYKLLSDNSSTNSQPAQVPSNPMGQGVMEDTYSDRLDIMACCKGDYSLYNRILSGWVPAAERAVISLQDVAAPPAGGRQFNFTLWPYDRPESVGQLKGVTIRLEDGKVLAVGYRSLAFWQDVRVGRSKMDTDARPLEPQHSRSSVAGLSVEYSKRWYDAGGSAQWSVRGLLDFNRVFGRYPDALPATAGAYPRDPPGAAFTLLREGDAWLDEEHNLLLAVDKVVDCTAPAKVPVHRYSVYNFYGFRGENPGEEDPEQADYTGYRGPMKCLQLRVRTGVQQAPGALDVRLKVEGVGANQRLVLDGSSCGYSLQPRLTLMPPDGVNLASVIWRDNSNTTFATGVLTAQLPPLSSLLERSATASDRCNQNCDWSYHIKAMADNGAQTLLDVTIAAVLVDKVMLRVRYTYYLRDRVMQALETHTIPVWLAGSGYAGQLLSASPVELGTSVQLSRPDKLPATTCSKQWTLTTLLQIPSGAWDYTLSLDIPVLAMQAPDAAPSTSASVSAGLPGLLLRITPGSGSSSKGSVLLIVTMAGRERWMDVTAGLPDGAGSKGSAGLHIALVRDGNRLGVWGNGVGGWVLQDVGCLPANPSVTYCTGSPAASSWAVGAVQLGQAGVSSRGVRASYLRMYNYALPKGEFDDESRCAAAAANCGRYLLQGWPRITPSITRGSVQREGASIQTWTASTPITLNNIGYYMLVGPWSACSARCGGGFASRTVRCMKMSARSGGPPEEVDLDECPITGGDDAPASSRRCNTVACPEYELQIMAPADGACNSTSSSCLVNQQRPSLVCASSYGFVQPLRFCQDPTLASNPTWSSLRLPMVSAPAPSPAAPNLTAMWSTSPLRLTLARPAATLAEAIAKGLLNSTCGSGAGCAATARWELGKWGACTKRCDSGTRTRTADCIQTSSGSLLPAEQCSRAHGPVLQMLSGSCNPQPCNPAVWKVTPWTACAGDAAYGHSSRQVTCVTSINSSVADAACTSRKPNSTAVCVRTAATAYCRPKFVPEGNYGAVDCYGHGSCSMRGCSCDDGWAGQFCEIATAKCSGVVDKAGKCCASGMVDVTGVCCAEGAVLDGAGACCKAGWVDACGTCGGKAWVVDVQGACCETRLDAAGFCCPSGYVDECGVCDGDSRSCAVDVYLTASPVPALAASTNATQQLQRVQLQKVWSSLLSAMPAAGAGTWRVVNVTEVTFSSSAASSNNSSRSLPDDATIVSKNTATRRLQADLAGSGSDSGAAAASRQTCSAEDAAGGSCKADYGQPACSTTEAATEEAAGQNGQCSAEEFLAADHQQPGGAGEVGQAAAAGIYEQRRRLAQVVSDNSTTVLVRIVPAPAETEGEPPATVPLALTSLSGPVAAALQQQSGAQQAAGQPPQPYGVLSVQMMERMGVCGNGVCEVGERPWVDAQGSIVQPATAACPQDCPMALVVCPAPLTVGDSTKECGGNGRCLRTQGTCDCFMGYTGDSCGECAAGYYAVKGRCLAQYIDGFNIFNDPSLANEPLLKGWQLWLVVGAGAAVLLLVLLVVGLCWLRAKRRGVLPAWLGGGRQPLSRKRKYQMDFDKGVAGGSASTSPSSGRIGAMPSPRNMLLQRLRYTTDSPMSSLAEEGGGGPRDVRQLQANPLYAVNNDGTYVLDHDDAEIVLAASAPPASPTVRAIQRAATRTGQQLSRAAETAGQSLSRAATAAQQGIARVLSGVPGVGPGLSSAISRGGSYQYTPVGTLEGEYGEGQPRHSAGYGSEDPGSGRAAELVTLESPREGAYLGGVDRGPAGGSRGAGAAGRAPDGQYGLAGRSMEEVYSQLMRNKEAQAAGVAAGAASSGAAAGGQGGGRYRVRQQQQPPPQQQQPPPQQQQPAPVFGQQAGPPQGRQAAGLGQRQGAEAAAEQESKRVRRGPPASRFGPNPVPGNSSGPSPDHHHHHHHHHQQQQPAGGGGMPQLRIRTAVDKPAEVAHMAPFQLPTAAGPSSSNQQQGQPREVLLDPRVAEAARAARVSEGGMGGGQLRARQRAVSQQGGTGFVSTPDYGDRDGIVAFGRRMEQWFSPDRSSSGGGSRSSGGGSSTNSMPALPVSRGAAGLEEGEPGTRQPRGPEAGRGKGKRQD